MRNSCIFTSERIKNSKGDIYKLIKKDNLSRNNICESYISTVKYNKIKAWKYHKKISLNLIVTRGKVLFITFENNNFNKYILNEKKFEKLFIPKKIWYGFMGLEKNFSTILSFSNYFNSESEIMRKDIRDLPFDWDKYK